MTVTAVRPLADEVWALLQAISNVNHHRAKVVIPPYEQAKPETHRHWDLDTSGRPENVHAYEVFYPGAGTPVATRSCATPASLAWSFQVTCVGGDDNRALWCVDKIRAGLHEAQVDDGYVIRPVRDYNPGPVQVDRDVSPYRYFLPLLYGVYIP